MVLFPFSPSILSRIVWETLFGGGGGGGTRREKEKRGRKEGRKVSFFRFFSPFSGLKFDKVFPEKLHKKLLLYTELTSQFKLPFFPHFLGKSEFSSSLEGEGGKVKQTRRGRN